MRAAYSPRHARTVIAAEPVRPQYRPQIDGIRALAVGAVVLFHLGFGWIPGGFIGVDVFFVLSGYLISGLLVTELQQSGAVRLGRFYARRARRLLPAAWVVIAFTVLVARVDASPLQYENLRRHAMSATLYVANWDWASVERGYFATDTAPSPLIHFWSLAVEEQFYLVWPLLVLASLWISRRSRRSLCAVLAVAFLVITVVSIALAVASAPSDAAFYGTHNRAFELSAGGLLAVWFRRPRRRPARRRWLTQVTAVVLTSAGAGALGYLVVEVSGSTGYPGQAAVAVTAATVLLIAGVDLADGTIPARVLGSTLPVWIGKLSYSIYLWHWPLIVFWKDDLTPATLVTAILAASALSYSLVEQPVRRQLWTARAAWPVAITGLAMSCLIGFLAIPLALKNSPQELQVLAARHDIATPPSSCPYAGREWPSPSRSDACVLVRGTGATVLLVGDSHAQMWAPTLIRLATTSNWRLLSMTRSQCVPTDFTIARPKRDRAVTTTMGQACTAWRHVAYPAAVERYDPDYVVVGARPQIYDIATPAGVVRQADPDFDRLWRRSWRQPIETLTADGAELLVMGPVPTMPAWLLNCLATRGRPCNVPATRDADTAHAAAVVRRIVRRSPRADLLDVQSLVCPDGMCPGRIGGVIVHQNRSHVTATFAVAQAPAFGRLLRSRGVPVAL